MSKPLPRDWKISTVGEACSIRNDLRLPISREERADMKGQYRYFGPTGELDKIETYRLDGTFALIGEDGDHFLEVEKKAQTQLVSGSFNVNNHAHVIESTDTCSAEWFYNYFRHRNLITYLTRQGAGRYKLNKAALQEIPIALPPPNEQRAISICLREWESCVEKTKRLISAKQKRNEELANRLLFGVTRLGKHDSTKTKALHWFTAPSDWQAVEIGDVAQEKTIPNATQIGLPVLSCTKYDGLVDSLLYFNKQIFSYDTAKYKVVERGQFAYATNHIEEGSIGYQEFLPAGLVSPMYTVFQPDAERIDGRYFYKLLKSEKMRQIFAARTNASVDRRGSLRWKDFARIPIALPSLAEQRKISQLLDEAAHEVALLQREVAALKSQKRGLMQKLLTGEWRVPLSLSEANEVRA